MTLPSFLTEKTVTQFMRMGANAVIALVSLGIIGYVLYLVLFNLSADVAAMKGDLPDVKTNTEKIMDQHMQIAPVMQEGNRIQCATCWNAANSAEEFDRCGCNPTPEKK